MSCLFLFGVHGFLKWDTKLLAERLELLQVLVVLTLVLDLVLDPYVILAMRNTELQGPCRRSDVPSKTRTAEGKSLTRRAARRAAVITAGDGTRS